MDRVISWDLLERYIVYLRQEEKSEATIAKYRRHLYQLMKHLAQQPVTKRSVAELKVSMTGAAAPSTVNGAIAAWNGFFAWNGWHDCRVKPLRVQRELFLRRDKELTKQEYFRLLSAAAQRKDGQLSLILQTICATGIRISELQFVTVGALKSERARIHCKGKIRTILLPKRLCRTLLHFCKERRIAAGCVFVTRRGNPLDRSNIWRSMKSLCAKAEVAWEKVFPHNLRHLFARCFYALEKDLDSLAAILGHSNINTTRIYTMSTDCRHLKTLERLRLLI